MPKSRRAIDSPVSARKQIKPVLYAADISTFEEAIKATGLINRGEALIEVCRFYLESKK